MPNLVAVGQTVQAHVLDPKRDNKVHLTVQNTMVYDSYWLEICYFIAVMGWEALVFRQDGTLN